VYDVPPFVVTFAALASAEGVPAVGANSKEPMSADVPIVLGKPLPRASTPRAAALSPALIRGLVLCSAMVCTVPPLLAKVGVTPPTKSGSVPAGRLPVPVRVRPVWSKTRLLLALIGPVPATTMSGLVKAVLRATTVPVRLRAPVLPAPVRAMPPPLDAAELPATVTLLSEIVLA
jgi:hypothetical protein